MQTFMPTDDYAIVSYQLDDKRLGKQRVEAYQILRALTGVSTGWVNHPATRMWQGYEYNLAEYGLQTCEEWISRGFNDSLYDKFTDALDNLPVTKSPWWVSDSTIHKTHQSNLLRKDWNHYTQFFDGSDNMPYLWPLLEENTYRCGTLNERNFDSMGIVNGKIYLTSTQVAEVCGVSKGTISAYKARGQMPAPDTEFGRTPLWLYTTIEKWRSEIRSSVTE